MGAVPDFVVARFPCQASCLGDHVCTRAAKDTERVIPDALHSTCCLAIGDSAGMASSRTRGRCTCNTCSFQGLFIRRGDQANTRTRRSMLSTQLDQQSTYCDPPFVSWRTDPESSALLLSSAPSTAPSQCPLAPCRPAFASSICISARSLVIC